MRLQGADISILDGGCFANVAISDFNEAGVAECDTLFIDYSDNIQELGVYVEAMKTAESMGKKVIISRALADKLQLVMKYSEELRQPRYSGSDKLYEINVPIVMVFSQGEYTDQFATELALGKHFKDEGYSVGQIGSRECSSFFGFPCAPDFLFESQDVYNNILRFNYYVKDLTDTIQPDLLIIGAPNSMMKHNNYILQGLGLVPYVISNAVSSDISIACLHYGAFSNSFYEEVSRHGHYHLGNPIGFFGLANTSASTKSAEDVELEYTNLDSAFVLKGISKNPVSDEFHLFNTLDKESVKNACIAVQEVLTGNVRYMR